jgi:hypothetical protein
MVNYKVVMLMIRLDSIVLESCANSLAVTEMMNRGFSTLQPRCYYSSLRGLVFGGAR